jgi:ADP-heptose:LPS heptosyltransferase
VPSLQLFEALAPVENVAWLSLQTGEQQTELNDAPAAMNVLDLSPHLKDFADTAAVISSLDLLITIDTATAHLAGALGAKTWTLVTAAPDWRWGWEGEATLWYPTMQLFRQKSLGDWIPPLKDVQRELTALRSDG